MELGLSLSIPGLALGGGGVTLAWARNLGAIAAGDFALDQSLWAGGYVGSHANIPGWSFARASAGYARNAAGVLLPFASGEMRRTDKGVLVEGARTNLCLRSQEFDNASWTKSRASIVANATTAPDGTLTADKLVEDSANGTHRAYQYVDKAASAITYTATIYAKAAERNFISVKLTDNTENDQLRAAVSLTTGEVTAVESSGGGFTAGVVDAVALADGWWRIRLTATSDTDTRVILFAQVASTLSPSASYQGDGVSGIYIWGAQIEAAAFPSSYIPTTTASATRAADVASIGSVTGIDYPLTLALWGERVVDTGGSEAWFGVNNSTNDELSDLRTNSSDAAQGVVRAGGAAVAQTTVGSIGVGQPFALAMRQTLNDNIVCFNGTLSAQDTSAANPATPNRVNFGEIIGGTLQPFGFLKRWAILPFAATNAQLQAMTT